MGTERVVTLTPKPPLWPVIGMLVGKRSSRTTMPPPMILRKDELDGPLTPALIKPLLMRQATTFWLPSKPWIAYRVIV